jgi:hypothetical protein
MRNVCIETILAFLMAGLMFAGCAIVSGCQTALPEPATTDGLSKAESRLDGLTDERIAQISASATVARSTVGVYPDSDNKKVITGELDVILAMTGEPNKALLASAEERSLKAGQYLDEAYAQKVTEAEILNKRIYDANMNYEFEKAKKEAEYQAALKEKEIELKQKKLELEQERLDKQAERWNLAGGFLLLAGLGLALATPMKQLGVGLAGCGLFIASVPFVMNEPWFKYSIIIIFSTGLVFAGWYVIKSRVSKVDNETTK